MNSALRFITKSTRIIARTKTETRSLCHILARIEAQKHAKKIAASKQKKETIGDITQNSIQNHISSKKAHESAEI